MSRYAYGNQANWSYASDPLLPSTKMEAGEVFVVEVSSGYSSRTGKTRERAHFMSNWREGEVHNLYSTRGKVNSFGAESADMLYTVEVLGKEVTERDSGLDARVPHRGYSGSRELRLKVLTSEPVQRTIDESRMYYEVPYGMQDYIKQAGGRWDPIERAWYVEQDSKTLQQVVNMKYAIRRYTADELKVLTFEEQELYLYNLNEYVKENNERNRRSPRARPLKPDWECKKVKELRKQLEG